MITNRPYALIAYLILFCVKHFLSPYPFLFKAAPKYVFRDKFDLYYFYFVSRVCDV
jgi:hypothetical protein